MTPDEWYLRPEWKRLRASMRIARVKYCQASDAALCEQCEALGKPYDPRQLVELHHQVKIWDAPERALDPHNLEFLCNPHHRERD